MNSTPAGGVLPVRFSIVTSESGPLTKTFRLNSAGELVKSVNTEMADGRLDDRRYESYCHLLAGEMESFDAW